jgi:hypothetical protein
MHYPYFLPQRAGEAKISEAMEETRGSGEAET